MRSFFGMLIDSLLGPFDKRKKSSSFCSKIEQNFDDSMVFNHAH